MSDLGDQVKWDDRGLVPAVVSHATSGAVLMLAWMNREALDATVSSGLCHFFSRSRGRLWKKGESSGNTLAVRELRLDCDGDAILVAAEPAGPACHTGQASCFFRRADGESWVEDGGPTGAPAAIVDRLYGVLESRRGAPPEQSYTASLLAGGVERIAGKIAEEQQELIDELESGESPDQIVHEAADLLFHVLAGLLHRQVEPTALWRELERRFGQSGHAEKAGRR